MKNDNNKPEKWENIVKIVYRNKNDVRALMTDETLRIRIQFFCVFLIFSVISVGMTVVNVITSWRLLMLSTLIFAIANIINIALTLINERTENLSRRFLAVELLALFAFFMIFGEPEGFSAIWIALLPACGLLLYRMKYGIILSTVQLALLIFLCWTKAGKSLLVFPYTDSFLLRFPLLYIAFFSIGIFFEYTRATTQEELLEMRGKFEDLSKKDPLTGLFNRLGFYSEIEQRAVLAAENGCALAIIDFDEFKSVNDNFGHLNGDLVLKKTSALISSIVGESGSVCRWGGDELAVFFNNATVSEELCEKILTSTREIPFAFLQPKHITLSIGLTVVRPGTAFTIAELIAVADNNLYFSKKNGKDRLNVSEYVHRVGETTEKDESLLQVMVDKSN